MDQESMAAGLRAEVAGRIDDHVAAVICGQKIESRRTVAHTFSVAQDGPGELDASTLLLACVRGMWPGEVYARDIIPTHDEDGKRVFYLMQSYDPDQPRTLLFHPDNLGFVFATLQAAIVRLRATAQ